MNGDIYNLKCLYLSCDIRFLYQAGPVFKFKNMLLSVSIIRIEALNSNDRKSLIKTESTVIQELNATANGQGKLISNVLENVKRILESRILTYLHTYCQLLLLLKP